MEIASSILDAALSYAELGWYVVPLYNANDDGSCSCHAGDACPDNSRGKHPRITEWQIKASTDKDQITSWWSKWPMSNLGVLLGDKSDLIDIECDSPKAEQDLLELFGGDVPVVPCFSAFRGKHRLFQWSSALMPLPKSDRATFRYGEIDFKIGGEGKGSQSVFPPSMHRKRIPYRWIINPEDAPLIELPARVIRALIAAGGVPVKKTTAHKSAAANGVHENVQAAGGTGTKSERWKLYEQDEVQETVDGRDNVIHAEACAQWGEQVKIHGTRCLDDQPTQSVVFMRIWGLNLAKCRPPLTVDEVQKKCESARKFIAQQEQNNKSGANLTSMGLEYRDGEWWPGTWKAVCVRSEPSKVKLLAPFLKKPILLSTEEFDAPHKVHLAVLGVTGNLCLDDKPGFWLGVWNGVAKTRNGPARRGLKCKLLDVAEFEDAPAEQKRPLVIATYLWSKLAVARPVDNDNLRSLSGGLPAKTEDGKLLFKFEAVWEEASRSEDRIKRWEMSDLLKELGCSDEWVGPKNERKKYKVLSPECVQKLHSILGNDDSQ